MWNKEKRISNEDALFCSQENAAAINEQITENANSQSVDDDNFSDH